MARKKSPNLLTLFPEYTKKKYQSRVLAMREQFLSELREAYLHQGLVLYVGAGVSQSLDVPSWSELIRSLTINMMTQKVRTAIDALGGLSEEKRWKMFSDIQEDVERGTDYDKPILMMARTIKDELAENLPFIVARALYRHTRLSRTMYGSYGIRDLRAAQKHFRPRIPSSPLVDSVVALARSERDIKGVQAIVNYNYDDLLDEKLRTESVRCLTVRSGRDHVPPGTLPSYHVHGVLPLLNFLTSPAKKRARLGNESFGNFVFSEDEYHAEYSDPYKWSNMTQMSLLGRYTGLFIGLSMEDPNIRRLIDVTHKQYPEITNYAILSRKKSLSHCKDSKQNTLRNLFEDVETSSFQKIGVGVIWADNHDEVPTLLDRIRS